MAFIDIFNFKKYFAKPSDSQVARYGHVNAVYDTLYNDFANGGSFSKGAYTTDTLGDTVNISTVSGTITFDSPSFITSASSAQLFLSSPLIKADSIIIFNVGVTFAPNINIEYPPATIDEGIIELRIYNTGSATVEITGITFLIIA